MQLFALNTLPLVRPGDDLGDLVMAALDRAGLRLMSGDLLVVAQKIVSKSEGRLVALSTVNPTERARRLAAETGKDARMVQLILDESTEIVRQRPGLLIVEHRLGFVHANAGIDQSNVDEPETALLLPLDPDASARALRTSIERACGVAPCVIVNDSCGRAWRNGVTGMAIGCAGFSPVVSRIGAPDLFGRPLQVTEIAVADELAAAASHLMGQGAEAVPVVLVRGARLEPAESGMAPLLRARNLDLFR